MSQESDRDILIRVDTTVKSMHEQLLGENGRVPKLEETQDEHAAKINTFTGSVKTLIWVVGGIGVLAMAFGGVLLAHIMGVK